MQILLLICNTFFMFIIKISIIVIFRENVNFCKLLYQVIIIFNVSGTYAMFIAVSFLNV